MKIIKELTKTNYTKSSNRKIEYIVVHYVGAVSTARNNANYFKNTYRGASAHYFVDENEIVQVVEDKDISWHCGADKYYSNARNSNSIGIEMCCYKKNGKIDISDKVVANTIELVKQKMKEYNIKTSNVVRHYDVTHKNCPAPFVSNESRWKEFKSKLETTTKPTKKSTTVLEWQKVMNKVYNCGLAEDNSFGPDCESKADKYYLYYEKGKKVIVNEHVGFIQNRLILKGYSCGPKGADNSYGPDTEKATKTFQKANGLKVDGWVGAKTTKLLLK